MFGRRRRIRRATVRAGSIPARVLLDNELVTKGKTMKMETLTYSYGETPVRVIEERFVQSESLLALDGAGEFTFYADDLLTVLDALHESAIADLRRRGSAVRSGHMLSVANFYDQTKCGELRIDILAALGIVEVA